MLAATVLSLICVPVFYALIESWRERGEKEHQPTRDPIASPAE
jgi:hypothetical protein